MSHLGDQTVRFTEAGVALTMKVCKKIVDNLEGGELGDATDTMRNVMANYVEQSREHVANTAALKSLKEKLAKIDPLDWPNVDQEFLKIRRLEENNNEAGPVEDHEWMKELNKVIANEADEDDNGDDDDEDVCMTQVEVNTICPISRTEMTRPVKNKTCGHVYDKGSIEAIVNQANSLYQITYCPVIGCPSRERRQPVRLDNLEVDRETKLAISRKRK